MVRGGQVEIFGVAYLGMTMGPEEIQYRLDVLDVVHPCTLFSWPAKRHGALPARSTIILVMVHRGPTITTFKALFCWGIAIVVVNKLFGWEIRVCLLSLSLQTDSLLYTNSAVRNMLPKPASPAGVIRPAPRLENFVGSAFISVFRR